jgi:glycosyltransferase involved in cell wall biosynthesis
VKTGPNALSVAQVNFAFDNELTDPDQLLHRYRTLTGWSDALHRAGIGSAVVVQRFHRDARLERDEVTYLFRRSAIPAAVAACRPDIVHVNGLSFPTHTWRLRRALDGSCAVVVQNHADGGPVGRAPLFRARGRATRSAVDGFLFAADEHAAWWRRAGFIAPRQPVYQVMEASTRLTPLPRALARAESGLSGSPAVLWVGRLNANKDPLTVLSGFERALDHLPSATLTMVYSEEEILAGVRFRVEQSAALADHVRLVGAVPHDRMAAFYSAADLFVAGSHHEGSGYALMEALACGAAPVVTDIPTFRLLTGGGSLGALWTPGDANDCARALIAAGRKDLTAERTRVLDHFVRELSWDVVGRRAVEIYLQVVEARRLASGKHS